MTASATFIEPLDVLFLRGNKLFGDPGSHGESLVPPWPSVAAGALRSRMLVDDGVDLAAFAAGRVAHPTLGTPAAPGTFTVIAFHLARRFADGRVEMLMAPPADLVIGEEAEKGQPTVRRLLPTLLAAGLGASTDLPLLPVLAEPERGKPASGYWLNEAGWRKYLAGDTPTAADLMRTSELWAIDHRVGVGLDAEHGRAADGRLFSVQAVAMKKAEHATKNVEHDIGFDVGFLACVTGASLPQGGLVRLGGDGRGAALHSATSWGTVAAPVPDLAHIGQMRRCRIVLTTPGLFAGGWQLPGTDANGRFALHGVRGRVVCAAVPRSETISGWDLANRTPKPAQRVAPAGSVYWLDEIDATPEALDKLAANGLWEEPWEDPSRRAEGFNRFAIATY